MISSTWLWDVVFTNREFSFAAVNFPTFLKSEEAGHVLKSEVVPIDARQAISWDWRMIQNEQETEIC
jgi:hypothetical protein